VTSPEPVTAHRHHWDFDDQGGHWCRTSHEEGCAASPVHDFPCDHPDEHAGEAEPPPGRLGSGPIDPTG